MSWTRLVSVHSKKKYWVTIRKLLILPRLLNRHFMKNTFRLIAKVTNSETGSRKSQLRVRESFLLPTIKTVVATFLKYFCYSIFASLTYRTRIYYGVQVWISHKEAPYTVELP